MKQTRIIIIFALVLILLSLSTGASTASFGVFKQDNCIDLLQTCNNCSYNNITSITTPNSRIAMTGISMTKNGLEYNYTFCNTSLNGLYEVHGFGDPDGYRTIWRYSFRVTPNGEESTSAMAFFYIGSIILLLFFIGASIYGFIQVESIWGKYSFVCITYLLLMGISFVAWRMVAGFVTSSPFLVDFLKLIFYFSMWAFFPFVILSFLYVLYMFYQLKEINRLVEKGVPYEEASRRSRR